MDTCTLALCLTLLGQGNMPEKVLEERASNCVELYELAEKEGVEPMLIISIAHTESRFSKKAVSKAGAMGIMQVLPRYFCPKKGKCDYTAAGIKAWKAWSKRRTIDEALCRYNSGRPCSESSRARYYSRTVMRKYANLIEVIRLSEECTPGC